MFFSSVLIASFLLAFMVLARSDGGHHPSRPHNHVDAASDSSIALVGAGWYAEQPVSRHSHDLSYFVYYNFVVTGNF